MPYKDPEKAREAKRKSAERRRAAGNQTNQEAEQTGAGGRPTIENAESAYGDITKETAISDAVMRRYNKSSCWAFIMYEDSAPADYEDQLRMIGVQAALSPWHDADYDSKGRLKKKHRHGILHWPGGTTTFRTAAGITRDVLHGTIPVPLVSPRGYYRYFTHLDNPKKAQYDPADIIHINGFDVGDFLELSSKEKAEIRFKLLELIIKADIVEYWDLVTYTMYNESAAVLDYVCTNTMFWQAALRSKRHMEQQPPSGAQG